MHILTHKLLAEISLLGMAFDAIGGLYLAYDLLGVKTGPLRTITRTSGYVALFFFGYFLVLGLRYAIVAATGMGLILATEYRLVDTGLSAPQARRINIRWNGASISSVLGSRVRR